MQTTSHSRPTTSLSCLFGGRLSNPRPQAYFYSVTMDFDHSARRGGEWGNSSKRTNHLTAQMLE